MSSRIFSGIMLTLLLGILVFAPIIQRVSTSSDSAGSNVLVNGDFETGTLNGWDVLGTCAISNTIVHSGSYSAYVSDVRNDNWVSQELNLPADGNYHFEGWVYPLKVGNLGPVDYPFAALYFDYYNKSSMTLAFDVSYTWCWCDWDQNPLNANTSSSLVFLLSFNQSEWNLLSTNLTDVVLSHFARIDLSQFILYNITAMYHYSNGDPGAFYLDDLALTALASASAMIPPSLTLLAGGAKWAAGQNGNSALFVDWEDNYLAHGNTDGINWGPWGPETVLINDTDSIAYVLTQEGLDVHQAGDFPNSLASYNLVVISAYFAVEPKDLAMVQDFIDNGGGMVLLGGVPEHFRTYSKTWSTMGSTDPLSVGMEEVFGCDGNYVNTGGTAYITVDNPFGTTLLTGDTVFEKGGDIYAGVMKPYNGSQVIATWEDGATFAYTFTYGQGRVYYQAEHDFLGSASATPGQSPPVASFSYAPTMPTTGQSITFNASSSSPGRNGTQTMPIVSYTWDFGDGNITSTNYSTVAHAYASPGTFNVTLIISDAEGTVSSYSANVSVVMSTFVSVSTSSTSALGSVVGINGTLQDAYGNRLENETVILLYTFQGVNSWYPISSCVTDSLGDYYLQWSPPATGYFTIEAEWVGNATYSGTSETTTLSTLPYQNQYVFSVESNSTISGIAFNATDSTLSFTASGPSGTTGYTKVTVAKSLAANPANIAVYLDGSQTQYSITSTDDSWLLTFNYTHSTHQVLVDLNTELIPEFPPMVILPLFVLLTMMVSAVLRKRKGHAEKTV